MFLQKVFTFYAGLLIQRVPLRLAPCVFPLTRDGWNGERLIGTISRSWPSIGFPWKFFCRRPYQPVQVMLLNIKHIYTHLFKRDLLSWNAGLLFIAWAGSSDCVWQL